MPLSITAIPIFFPVQPYWLAIADPTVPAVRSRCFTTLRSGETRFTPGSWAINGTSRSGTLMTCTLGTWLKLFFVVAPFPDNKANRAAVGVLENCTTTVTLFEE